MSPDVNQTLRFLSI